MTSIKRILADLRIHILNFFKRGEKIGEAKLKWNKLAREDANYYIFTNEAAFSEAAYRKSGEDDVQEHLLGDDLMKNAMCDRPVLLEIGCGNGRLSEFIAPHVATLYGVDISEEMIARAQSRLGRLRNCVFLATDGMSFPLEDESVDVVFSFIVFQHMPSVGIIRKNIEDVARVLKPGGIVKIQLRGMPVDKDKWYYGPSFSAGGVRDLVRGTSLSVLRLEGEGERYFWVWLKRA